MRIAIDAHSLGTKSAGKETYIQNLLDALSRIDKENEYLIYTSADAVLNFPSNYKVIKIKTKNRWLRLLYLRSSLKKNSPDIYHCQYFLPPFFDSPSVITIHDTSFLTHPECFTNREKLIFKFLNNSIRRAKKIITISNFSKNELLKYFKIPREKIDIISLAANEIFKPDIHHSAIHKIKLKYSLPDNYILYVGRFTIWKNIPVLIKAFSFFKKQDKAGFKLVLAGKNDRKSKDLKRLVSELNLWEEVKFIDYLYGADLSAVYNAAKLFVFPSFYEGFGMPPLEAMACGIPVITSNASVFPEVLGDAATMIDPYDAEGLAKAMEKLLSDNALREKMILKGLEQAKKFSWINTAQKTLAAYKEAGL